MIKKIFTEIYRLDMEGRNGWWETTDKTYEEICKKGFNGFLTGVRVVEKIFNPETFEINNKIIKITENKYNWKTHKFEMIETVY